MPTTINLKQFIRAPFIAFTPILQLEKIETDSNLRSWYAVLSDRRRQVRNFLFFLLNATNGFTTEDNWNCEVILS